MNDIVVYKFQRLLYDTYCKVYSNEDAFNLTSNHFIFEEFKLLPDNIDGYPPKSDADYFCFYCFLKHLEEIEPLSTPAFVILFKHQEQLDHFINDLGFFNLTGFIKSQQEKEKIINNAKIIEPMITPTKRRRI